MARNCHFGYKIEETPICIDYWNAKTADEGNFNFLTHVHQHSILSLNEFWQQPIYCSSITAKIASVLLDIPSRLFIPMEIGQIYFFSCDRMVGFVGKSFQVTPLESDHCLGSVMFLFHGWFGRILATGSFRFENEELFDLEKLCALPIDRLYLDVTNWKREQESDIVIPTRIRSVVQTLEEIAKLPMDETILLVMPDSIVGQERLLMETSRNFDQPIAVPKKRMEILEAIEKHHAFTMDQSATRFRLISGSYQQVNKAFVDELNSDRMVSIFIFVTPVSYEYWKSILDSSTAKNYEFRRCAHLIPYSDHCSSDELKSFLNCLTIRHVIPVGRDLDASEVDLLRIEYESVQDPERYSFDHDQQRNVIIGTPPQLSYPIDSRQDGTMEISDRSTPVKSETSVPERNAHECGADVAMEDLGPNSPDLKHFMINENDNLTFTDRDMDWIKEIYTDTEFHEVRKLIFV